MADVKAFSIYGQLRSRQLKVHLFGKGSPAVVGVQGGREDFLQSESAPSKHRAVHMDTGASEA